MTAFTLGILKSSFTSRSDESLAPEEVRTLEPLKEALVYGAKPG